MLSSQDTRAFIDWVIQEDGSSCGPLCIAVLTSARLGLKPCKASLGVPQLWTELNAKTLRSSIIGFKYGQLLDRDHQYLKGLDDFSQITLWLFSWEDWRLVLF
jgi:hypothetical protein